jgi:poly(3-hydroxybutyrate) depolymerase
VRYAAAQHRALPVPDDPMLLYQMHEFWRAGMAPYTYWAEAGAKMFSAPGSWLAGMPEAQRMAAGYELLYRIGKDYEKPEFNLHAVEIDGQQYPVVEREVMRTIGADNLHVISVCQSTVPVLAAVSLMAAHDEPTPRSLVMMGGPIDTRESPTAVNNLATQKSLSWFENNVIQQVPPNFPGRGRSVYPGFLQHAGFMAMNPERHFQSHWDFYQDLVKGDLEDAAAHRRFYDEYNAVLDMPAEYYLDTVRIVFQEHLLPRGLWDISGERVSPSAIRDTALLTVEGELDDISGQGQTRAAHGLCSGVAEADHQHMTVAGAGHYGIFSGRRWRTEVYPAVRDFIAARS